MQYWNCVLQEVVYKNEPRDFLFTHHDELEETSDFFPEENIPIIKLKEAREIRTYYLGDEYPDVHLTKREAECMFWMMQDFTIPQTACNMALSARTVEFYVKKLKIKLHCKSKKTLIDKILQTSLLQQLEKEGLQIVRH